MNPTDPVTVRAGELRRWPARALAVLLVAPSIWWILQDGSVWSWDPSQYAVWSVDLWRVLTTRPSAWWGTMMEVLQLKAPGFAWFGQLFVPFGAALGSIERALLLSVTLVQVGSLVLTYRLAGRLRPKAPFAPALAALFVAAGPLFVAMSHHYMTEAPQLFCVAYVFYVSVRARDWPAGRTLTHLALALALGLVVKLATPSYVLFPAALAVFRAARRGRREGVFSGIAGRELALLAVTCLVVVLGAGWYWRNGRTVLWFVRLAATDPFWGQSTTLSETLWYWARTLRECFFTSQLAWLGLPLVALLSSIRWARARRSSTPSVALEAPASGAEGEGDDALVVASVLQLLLVFALLASTHNEEKRYLLALGPPIVVALLSVLPPRRSPILAGALGAALLLQWGVVNARALGWLPEPWRYYWANAPMQDAHHGEVTQLVARTCTEETAGRRVISGVNFIWINPFSLEFFGAKHALLTGHRCSYEESGPSPHDLEREWSRIQESQTAYYVSIEPEALGKPDRLNEVTLPLLERVRRAPRFEPVPFDSASRLLLFRHTSEPPASEAR